MIDPATLLPPPHPEDYRENKMWVDEQIWGHRLYDAQSSWMLFLEFLNVAEACHRSSALFEDVTHLSYKLYKRIHLRNILFNNQMLFEIARKFPDNGMAWANWLQWM